MGAKNGWGFLGLGNFKKHCLVPVSTLATSAVSAELYMKTASSSLLS